MESGSETDRGIGTNCMNGNVFLDTNILVYAIDSSPEHSRKSNTSRQIISQCIQRGTGIISIQVLQEFFVVATRKIASPLTADQAMEFLNHISVMEIVSPDYDMVVAAVRTHKQYQTSFWDAMIIQAAVSTGCNALLSEDLQAGMEINGLTISNPFH